MFGADKIKSAELLLLMAANLASGCPDRLEGVMVR
jgi:hypothetical protein